MKDPLAKLPGYVLRRASSAALTELNQRLEPLKLRHADAAFLLLIDGTPGISQSEAGRILEIQRANMVPFVSRLERRGLIDRTKVDGRSQALAKARRVIGSFEASLMNRVPEKMRPMVLPILMALWKGPDSSS
jgi:hypothetical protein